MSIGSQIWCTSAFATPIIPGLTDSTPNALIPFSQEYTASSLAIPIIWDTILKTAESIQTGSAQAKLDYTRISQDELEAH